MWRFKDATDIAKSLIPDDFGTNKKVAVNAVQYFLSKHMDEKERKDLSHVRKRYFGSRGGKRCHEIHGKTPPPRTCSKGGCARALQMGYKPWTREEEKYAYNLSQKPEFCYSSGPNKGRPIHRKIAETVNKRFHNGNVIRNPKAVGIRISVLNKQYKDHI